MSGFPPEGGSVEQCALARSKAGAGRSVARPARGAGVLETRPIRIVNVVVGEKPESRIAFGPTGKGTRGNGRWGLRGGCRRSGPGKHQAVTLITTRHPSACQANHARRFGHTDPGPEPIGSPSSQHESEASVVPPGSALPAGTFAGHTGVHQSSCRRRLARCLQGRTSAAARPGVAVGSDRSPSSTSAARSRAGRPAGWHSARTHRPPTGPRSRPAATGPSGTTGAEPPPAARPASARSSDEAPPLGRQQPDDSHARRLPAYRGSRRPPRPSPSMTSAAPCNVGQAPAQLPAEQRPRGPSRRSLRQEEITPSKMAVARYRRRHRQQTGQDRPGTSATTASGSSASLPASPRARCGARPGSRRASRRRRRPSAAGSRTPRSSGSPPPAGPPSPRPAIPSR